MDDDERRRRVANENRQLAEDLQTAMAVFTAVITTNPHPAAVAAAIDNARDAGLTDQRLVKALLVIARFGYEAAATANRTTADVEIQKDAALIASMVERYREGQADEGSSS